MRRVTLDDALRAVKGWPEFSLLGAPVTYTVIYARDDRSGVITFNWRGFTHNVMVFPPQKAKDVPDVSLLGITETLLRKASLNPPNPTECIQFLPQSPSKGKVSIAALAAGVAKIRCIRFHKHGG